MPVWAKPFETPEGFSKLDDPVGPTPQNSPDTKPGGGAPKANPIDLFEPIQATESVISDEVTNDF